MRKLYQFMGFSSFIFLFLFLCGIYFSTHLTPSYAIPTGVDRSGIPTSTFTSNINSSSTTNYVKDALTSKGNSSNFADSFGVPSNMKTNNNANPLYKLSKNYTTPSTSERFEIIDGNPTGVTDKGLLYILAHGYNSTNTDHSIFSTNTYGAVTDNTIKQYVTQIALWLYIYEKKSSFSTYCENSGCDFLNTSNTAVTVSSVRELISSAAEANGFNYLNYITLLVDNAKNYSGSQVSRIASVTGTTLNYQINSTFTLLVTDAVTPSVSSNNDNFMYYSIEIKDPNNYGVYLVDNNNTKITNLDVFSGSFKVAVPLKEDISSMDLSSIEIQIYGHFVKDDGYAYRVTSKTTGDLDKHDMFSNVLLGYTPHEVVGTSFKLYNFVKISKVDITNSSELPGATLVVTNKADESKKQTWVSTNTPHYIYLEDGNYSLCETIAPEGFALNTECIDFTVDGSKIVTVTMENQPTIEDIPDTSKFTSKLLYSIGFSFLLIGLIITGVVFIKKNQKSA